MANPRAHFDYALCETLFSATVQPQISMFRTVRTGDEHSVVQVDMQSLFVQAWNDTACFNREKWDWQRGAVLDKARYHITLKQENLGVISFFSYHSSRDFVRDYNHEFPPILTEPSAEIDIGIFW